LTECQRSGHFVMFAVFNVCNNAGLPITESWTAVFCVGSDEE